MTIKENYETLLVEIRKEFPDFHIIKKEDSRLMKLIDVCLKIISFGQMKTFMTDFITTLGSKVYIMERWESVALIDRIAILRHERVHMRQARRYGRFLFSF